MSVGEVPWQYSCIGEAGEKGLLAYLKRRFGRPSAGVLVPVGDDAAVFRPSHFAPVVCSDTLVEHEDFDFQYTTWGDVGHKAAAVTLSDIAAMGANPRGLLLSLALRPDDMMSDFVALIDGFVELARKYDCELVGGDISKTSGPLIVTVQALGEVEPDRILRRSFGLQGDRVFVTGTVGSAAVGLELLRNGRRRPNALVKRQLRPQPQLKFGRVLAQATGVTACADVSDGLARDALHLPRPGLGVRIDAMSLPISPELRAVAGELGRNPIELALAGGEDFELVIAVGEDSVDALKVAASTARIRLTEIGEIVETPGLHLTGVDDGASFDGFDHFSARG